MTLGSSWISPLTEIMPVAAGCIWNSLNAPFQNGTAETSKQRHTMLMSRRFMKDGLFLNLIRPSTNTSVISSFPTVCSWVLMVNPSGSFRCRLHAIWLFSTRTSAWIALIHHNEPKMLLFKPSIWCQQYVSCSLCRCYLPVNLFFPKDQVNQEDPEDPKSGRGAKEECCRESEVRAGEKGEIEYVNGKQ